MIKRPRKQSVTYTVVHRKTVLFHLNMTFIDKVLYTVMVKIIKSLFLCKKSKITDT